MKNKKITLLVLCLACAVIFAVANGSTTLAAYRSQETGTATATAASFYIDGELEVQKEGSSEIVYQGYVSDAEADVTITIGSNTYVILSVFDFKVTNQNGEDAPATDVDIEYTIEIFSTGNIPFSYFIEEDSSYKEYTDFSGKFEAGKGVTKEHRLYVLWLEDEITWEYAAMVDYIEIDIIATQFIG